MKNWGVCTIISTKNKKIYQAWHKITKKSHIGNTACVNVFTKKASGGALYLESQRRKNERF